MNGTDTDFASLVQGKNCLTKGDTDIETKEFQCLIVKSIDESKRQIHAIASNESIDTDGEIVKLSACKKSLPGYMKNPVILAAHTHRLSDGSSPVIAKCVKAWVDKSGLNIIIEYAKTSLGDEYWHLYSDKFQRAFSIGFRVLAWEMKTIGGKQVRVITELMLIEISCVAVPANPDALSKAKQRKSDFVAAKRQQRKTGLTDNRIKEIFMEEGVCEESFEGVIETLKLFDDPLFESEDDCRGLAKDIVRIDEDDEDFSMYDFEDEEKDFDSDVDFQKIITGKSAVDENDFVNLVSGVSN